MYVLSFLIITGLACLAFFLSQTGLAMPIFRPAMASASPVVGGCGSGGGGGGGDGGGGRVVGR